MVRKVPRARAGLGRLAASPVPPAPIRVWASSTNGMMGVGGDWTSSMVRMGVVLPPPREDIHELSDLLVAPDDGVDLAVAGPFREIDGEFRSRAPADLKAAGCAEPGFRGVARELVDALGQGIDADLVELPGDADQSRAQAPGLEDAYHEMGAYIPD